MNAASTLTQGVRPGTRVTVSLPGTCGEWVQGTFDGVPCLVSCPIDWFGSVSVEIRGQRSTRILPPAGCKTAVAIEKARKALDETEAGVILRSSNPLPRRVATPPARLMLPAPYLPWERRWEDPFRLTRWHSWQWQ